MSSERIDQAFALAKERYAAIGVDVDRAIRTLESVAISLHCWQGDDVGGFEGMGSDLGGGLAVTGNYPGKARTPDELRADIDKVLSLLPGKHRVNLHAMYGEFGGKRVDRDEVAPEHFATWIAWAKDRGLGVDFNPTYFAHPKADDGFTLSHRDPAIRDFWIQHGIRSREIGAAFGKALGKTCITNFWMPDGYKDMPADRLAPRRRMAASLDAIFAPPIPKEHNVDSVEPKLFGIGSESYVTGSHEFYLGYAISRGTLMTLDAGHYHPTETISDKLSAILLYVPEVLLHVSRGVRWDSDHVVAYTDDLQAIAQEIVRADALSKVHVGLDYFDAQINRIAAWTIGARNMIRALLVALLEPIDQLRGFEDAGDYTSRLAIIEEVKSLPSGAVWDYYCSKKGVPVGSAWLDQVKEYEKTVLSGRA